MGDETTKYWTERNPPPVDGAIAALAEGQYGVVCLTQLRRLELSPSAVRSRVSTGRLHRLHRGVYAVGRPTVTHQGRWMAAVLACGPGAVLSHRSALELWGVAKMSRRRPSVTVPGVRRTREKIDVHRSATLTPDDLTAVDAIPCTTLARTLLDFAEIARPKELARAVEDAERIRIFDGHAVERVLSRANGRRGATKLRTALDNWTEPAFTRSEAERMMLALIARAGLPTPNANAFVAGHEVDLHWPQQRLVVEIDSRAWHTTPPALERDHIRDADYDEAGHRVRRFTARQIERDPAFVLERLRRALGM